MSVSSRGGGSGAGLRACSAAAGVASWLGCLSLGAGGCQEAVADVTIAWVDAADGVNGTRRLQIYDRGDRFSAEVIPDERGSDPDRLLLQVDPRGRGIAIAGKSAVTYLHTRESQKPRLSTAATAGRDFSSGFTIARNGDAMTRRFDGDGSGEVAFIPLTSASAGEVSVLTPPATAAGGAMHVTFASDAPVGFWVEQSGSPARGWGRISAFLYPSEFSGEMPVVEDVTTLPAGELFVAIDSVVRTDRHAPQWWCPGGVCVSSDGRSLTAMADDRCAVSWWKWEDGVERPGVVLEPEVVRFEQGCPLDRRPSIFAQLSHDVVVLDDSERIYVGNLSTRTLTAGPKIWESDPVLRLAERGRALVVVAVDSRVTRIDAEGVRVLSAEAFPCFGPPTDARVSPSGLWIIRTCNGQGGFIPADQGTVVRVSPLGVDVFPGVPMLPLGIDDLGNAVLNSQSEEGEPRGLFVLSGDGTLSRIDPLEPEPARVSDALGSSTYFATTPLRP